MSPNSSEPPRLSFQSFGGVAHSIVPMTNLPQFLKIKYILLFTAEMVSSFKFLKTVLRLNSARLPPPSFFFSWAMSSCHQGKARKWQSCWKLWKAVLHKTGSAVLCCKSAICCTWWGEDSFEVCLTYYLVCIASVCKCL